MATTLTPRRIESESRQMVSAVDLCPEGQTLLVGQYASGGPPVLSTFDAATGARRAVIDSSKHRNVEAARFLGAGMIAYVTGEPTVALANVASGHTEYIALSDSRPSSLSVTPSGRIAAGGTHVSILATSGVIATVPAPAARPEGEPARVAIAPDGRIAAAGVEDGCVAILDGTSGAVTQRLAPAPSFARWAQFSPDGHHVVVIEGYSHGVFGWDVASGSRWLPELLHEGATSYWCGAFHADSRRLYLGTNSGFVELIDVTEGRIVWSERLTDGRIWDMAASKGHLAFGGDDGAWIRAIE